jgi:hypothetical protein
MFGTKVIFNQGGGALISYNQIHVSLLICTPVLVSGSSDTRDVKFGQRYNLPNWADPPTVVTDPQAPANGFTFNNGVIASAVVALKVSNPDGSSAFVPSEFCSLRHIASGY